MRRNTEPQPPKNVFDRSVYAKGFGFDERGGELLSEIQIFLNKWGKVNVVRMRRDNDKKFKVSFVSRRSHVGADACSNNPVLSYIVAEFEDFEAAKKFVGAPQEEKIWNGEPFIIMTKYAWISFYLTQGRVIQNLFITEKPTASRR